MKVLIADDHALFRDALGKLVEELDGSASVIQVSSYAQALKILKNEPNINLVIVDLEMQDLPSWEKGMDELKSAGNGAKLVVVSAVENPRNIRNVLERGANGYISKRSESKILLNALKLVLDGGTYIPPVLLLHNNAMPERNSVKNLTNRQSQVLGLVAQGLSNKQIAYEMGVSEATVKLHINALLRSVGANNRTQAVITAQKMGII